MLRVTWSIHRRRLLIAGAALFVAGALAGVLRMLPPTPVAPVLLGDSAAPRAEPAAPALLPADPPAIRPAAAPAPAGPGSGPPRPGADRGLLATRLPDEAYQAPALAAIQCAAGAGITHDAALDAAAASLWRATVAAPELELAPVAGDRFAYVAAVPVTLAPGLAPAASPDAACPFAGTDFAQLDLAGLSAVGVAVFADTASRDGMDDSTVMIVGR